MLVTLSHRRVSSSVLPLLFLLLGVPALASEIWVAPTSQQDLGGLSVANNIFWPVTPIGAVRLAWGVPDDLATFKSAKILVIPDSTGPGTLNVIVCAAQDAQGAAPSCGTPPQLHSFPFARVANQLAEVEVTSSVTGRTGVPGETYLAVLAYTTPSTALAASHIVGLRFAYTSVAPGGAAGLGANTFTGTQTAPAFVGSFSGNGAGLTNLPVPAGVATLGANKFSGTQQAPWFIGDNATIFNGIELSTGTMTMQADPLMSVVGGNAYLGRNAGSNILNPNSLENTGIGNRAFRAGGNQNTAIGADAMYYAGSGNRNIAIGYGAGNGLRTGGSNNIYVGSYGGAADESNTLRIGTTSCPPPSCLPAQTRAFIGGIRGATTGVADAIPVVIDSQGQLGTVNSSRRFKEDVADMGSASRRLFDLRPVTFRYSSPYANGAKPIQFGLVAEEVADAFPELAVRDANGTVETVHYETLNVLLLNEVQRQEQRIMTQEQRIQALEAEIQSLRRLR